MKVIYIDIDSLRPDRLGVYGYHRPTSPNIDRIAKEGVRFTRCYTSDSPCMPSRSAAISGRFGIRNGVVTHGDSALTQMGNIPTLPEVLRENGVKASVISTFGRHPSPWFYVGWQEYRDPIGWRFQQTPAWKINESVISWLDDNANDDFFLWVHYWDPHAVYDSPKSLVNFMGEHSLPVDVTPEMIESHQNDHFWHCAKMMGIYSHDDYANMINEYDAEVRYVDYYVGQLVDELDRRGILDETMIIVASDHGEGLGENGVYVEHWSTNETVNRIPLIVKFPHSQASGSVSSSFVYQLDIPATVCEAFHIQPPMEWDSQSLFPFTKQTDLEKRSHVVVGHGLYTAQRSVVTKEWKLTRTMNGGEWKYPALQLFHLPSDPFEHNNVVLDNTDVVNRLNAHLTDWEYKFRPEVGIDPLVMVSHDGPPGLRLYGDQAEKFYQSGIPTTISLENRKPDIPINSF